MAGRSKGDRVERYEVDRSPFSQRPTQRKIAELLGETRDDLRRFVNYKEKFIKRADKEIRGKIRNLVYPVGRLRRAHERMKDLLNRVRHPPYLFSPRSGVAQLDNAKYHIDKVHFLTFDIKKFYPSTTEAMVWEWFRALGMYDDVAGLLTKLCTIGGIVSFGSPLTPVLCALVHRKMFDEICELCQSKGLRMSIWVDDVTISGNFVTGNMVSEIREIIRRYGFKTHKIKFRTGNRPVFITGVGIIGDIIIAPGSVHRRIGVAWSDLEAAQTYEEFEVCVQRLLAQLGVVRYLHGPDSPAGRRAADSINSLKQKRIKRARQRRDQSMTEIRERWREMGDTVDAPF